MTEKRRAPEDSWQCRDRHWLPENWCTYCLAKRTYTGSCREHVWPMREALNLRNADAVPTWESEGGR